MSTNVVSLSMADWIQSLQDELTKGYHPRPGAQSRQKGSGGPTFGGRGTKLNTRGRRGSWGRHFGLFEAPSQQIEEGRGLEENREWNRVIKEFRRGVLDLQTRTVNLIAGEDVRWKSKLQSETSWSCHR